MDVLDAAITLASVIAGGGLTQMVSGSSANRSARDQARDELASYKRFAWSKGGDNDWIELQVYSARISGKLSAAGVPALFTSRFASALTEFWMTLMDSGDPEVGWYQDSSDNSDELELAYVVVVEALSHKRRRRRDAKELAKLTSAQPRPTT